VLTIESRFFGPVRFSGHTSTPILPAPFSLVFPPFLLTHLVEYLSIESINMLGDVCKDFSLFVTKYYNNQGYWQQKFAEKFGTPPPIASSANWVFFYHLLQAKLSLPDILYFNADFVTLWMHVFPPPSSNSRPNFSLSPILPPIRFTSPSFQLNCYVTSEAVARFPKRLRIEEDEEGVRLLIGVRPDLEKALAQAKFETPNGLTSSVFRSKYLLEFEEEGNREELIDHLLSYDCAGISWLGFLKDPQTRHLAIKYIASPIHLVMVYNLGYLNLFNLPPSLPEQLQYCATLMQATFAQFRPSAIDVCLDEASILMYDPRVKRRMDRIRLREIKNEICGNRREFAKKRLEAEQAIFFSGIESITFDPPSSSCIIQEL